jgi:hypothetical protein
LPKPAPVWDRGAFVAFVKQYIAELLEDARRAESAWLYADGQRDFQGLRAAYAGRGISIYDTLEEAEASWDDDAPSD